MYGGCQVLDAMNRAPRGYQVQNLQYEFDSKSMPHSETAKPDR